MANGDLYINGKDAYSTWGITLDTSGLSALMTPAPMKEIISNSSRLEHGKRVLNVNPKKDARDVTLTFNIEAYSESNFMSRYASFCSELETGSLIIRTRYQSSVYYRMNYISCSQFSEFRRGVGKFVLKLNEPNPDNRSQ